jgi:hypothetical protein
MSTPAVSLQSAQIVLQEWFCYNPPEGRPHGPNGDLQVIDQVTKLDGFWAAVPGTSDAAWISATPFGEGGWTFFHQGQGSDHCAPSESKLPNGTAIGEDFSAALLPFTPPAGPFNARLEVLPYLVSNGEWMALGFTSSTKTMRNFEEDGQVWVLVRGFGGGFGGTYFELHTDGMKGPWLQGGTNLTLGFIDMSLDYDPVRHWAFATVGEVSLGPISYTATGIQAVGMEVGVNGNVIVDNFMVRVDTIFPEPPLFRRGDINDDGLVDLSDVVALLSYLFLDGWPPSCPDAADVDGEGDQLELTDAIYLLSALFLAGPPPVSPGPETCGAPAGYRFLPCSSKACARG